MPPDGDKGDDKDDDVPTQIISQGTATAETRDTPPHLRDGRTYWQANGVGHHILVERTTDPSGSPTYTRYTHEKPQSFTGRGKNPSGPSYMSVQHYNRAGDPIDKKKRYPTFTKMCKGDETKGAENEGRVYKQMPDKYPERFAFPLHFTPKHRHKPVILLRGQADLSAFQKKAAGQSGFNQQQDPLYVRSILQLIADTKAQVMDLYYAGEAHYDMKPDNILIFNNTGNLIDFGGTGPRTNDVAHYCTTFNRAPETKEGHQSQCEKVDVWGLGFTLAELLINNGIFAFTSKDKDTYLEEFRQCKFNFHAYNNICYTEHPLLIETVSAAKSNGSDTSKLDILDLVLQLLKKCLVFETDRYSLPEFFEQVNIIISKIDNAFELDKAQSKAYIDTILK